MPQPNNSDVLTGDKRPVPLCVDLDETLIRTDILWESVVELWRSPVVALRALSELLLHGKAAFKTVLAEGITIDPATLPYGEDVLEFVKSQHGIGRDVILVTATHHIVAQRVADYLGVFCRVFATEGGINLSGVHKRAALGSSYGKYGFDYVGDDQKDLAIREHLSRRAPGKPRPERCATLPAWTPAGGLLAVVVEHCESGLHIPA